MGERDPVLSKQQWGCRLTAAFFLCRPERVRDLTHGSWSDTLRRQFRNNRVGHRLRPNGCSAERDGIVVFRDAQHMTATFAASLAKQLGSVLSSHQKGKAIDVVAH